MAELFADLPRTASPPFGIPARVTSSPSPAFGAEGAALPSRLERTAVSAHARLSRNSSFGDEVSEAAQNGNRPSDCGRRTLPSGELPRSSSRFSSAAASAVPSRTNRFFISLRRFERCSVPGGPHFRAQPRAIPASDASERRTFGVERHGTAGPDSSGATLLSSRTKRKEKRGKVSVAGRRLATSESIKRVRSPRIGTVGLPHVEARTKPSGRAEDAEERRVLRTRARPLPARYRPRRQRSHVLRSATPKTFSFAETLVASFGCDVGVRGSHPTRSPTGGRKSVRRNRRESAENARKSVARFRRNLSRPLADGKRWCVASANKDTHAYTKKACTCHTTLPVRVRHRVRRRTGGHGAFLRRRYLVPRASVTLGRKESKG